MLLLVGCATFSTDGGIDTVSTAVQERTGAATRLVRSDEDAAAVRTLVVESLAAPLTPDAAVRIALVNNASLQARYAELGIVEAELVQAGQLPNPRFSFSRLGSGGDLEIERKFIVDVVAVLLMPMTLKLERERFAMAQTSAALDAVRIAAEARRAAIAATAAAQSVLYYEQVQLAADASAELARRMAAAGNWNALSQARQQLFYADATTRLARARQAAALERERLARVLGLATKPDTIRLPDRLPDLPPEPRSGADIEASALAQRLEVSLARRGLDATAYALDLTRANRWINVFDLAYKNQSDAGVPRRDGYEIEIEIPIFDWGDAKLARAEAIYRQSAQRLVAAADDARSEARVAYVAYRTAYDLARHYRDEIVPLRKRIADENLLRYNGMLLSVFELLADAREQVGSVNAALDAQRDFWLADADLQAALSGGGVAAAPAYVKGPETEFAPVSH
ncbi:MAG: TolC family protein [Casimicrobiaceae bacterium]